MPREIAPPPELQAVFGRLRDQLQKYTTALRVKTDTATCYCLEGGVHPTHKTAMPVIWVQIGKNYVSYHFMPVYGYPKLMERFSADLRARMQGKACFNFRTVDEALFRELDQMTDAGLKAFKTAGFMGPRSGAA